MKKTGQLERMTTTPVLKLLIQLSVPAVLSMMITTIYNLADTAFVGRLGTSQSGATGIVFSYMSILQAIAFMSGQGGGSILSRALGRGDEEDASKNASSSFLLSFGLGCVIALLTRLFLEPLLRLLGSTDTILPYAKKYIICLSAAAPFFTSSYSLNNLLRYEGRARLGTAGMMTGAVLNIFLDPLFMFVFDMGITGAGIATAISQFVSFSIMLSMYLRGKTDAKILPRLASKSPVDYWNIISTGSPSLLRQGLNSIAAMLLNRAAAAYGDAAVSAISCVGRISFFAMAIAIGIGQGFQPISSFNYGAGKKDRVRKAYNTATILQVCVLFVLLIPMFSFAPQLIGFMRNDPQVIEIGTRALRLMSVCNLFVPFTMMTEMGFQSIGMRKYAVLGSSLRSGILFIPLLFILPTLRGLAGVQEAQPLSFVLSSVISLFLRRVYLREMS